MNKLQWNFNRNSNIYIQENALENVVCEMASNWTNAGILLIRNLGTKLSEIFSERDTISFKKTQLEMTSGKWRPFCLRFNVLI